MCVNVNKMVMVRLMSVGVMKSSDLRHLSKHRFEIGYLLF